MKKYLILFFILVCFSPVYGAAGFQFLDISPSPAHLALGDAGTSLPLNNTCNFLYNPALLTFNPPQFNASSPFINRMDFYLSYIKYIQDINVISFFSLLDIKKVGRIGLGFSGFVMGEIESTVYDTGSDYSVGEKVNISSYSFMAGYGISLSDRIGVGLNIKLPIEDEGDTTQTGLGTDIGGVYKGKDWDIGLVIKDTGNNLPMKIIIGGNYNFYLLQKKYPKMHKLTITMDLGQEINDSFIAGAGLQYCFNGIIFLRNGYYLKDGLLNIRAGFGLQYKNYVVDYTYNQKDLGNIHRIGLGMKFELEGSNSVK